jgi:NAD(P)-dependent dehydrogenase (short-subunit alcohol dehydrogenase family)
MNDLAGRVALVTGAGPNIGRTIAVTLGRAGAFVYCNDASPAAAEAAAKAVREARGQAEPLPFDVADAAAVVEKIGAANSRRGPIDILVNNAAITIPKSVLDVSVAEWRRVIDINLSGMFFCSQAVARDMVKAGKGGAIVNIASTSGHLGRTNAIAYCSSKGGVLNFTRAMAADLVSHGIRVNSVSPTKTGVSVGALESVGTRTFDEIPMGRLGKPQEQANAVLFLVSDMASFVTGIDLRVDGGTLCTWASKTKFDQPKK